MSPQLVYLHIPKTGGTAQHALFSNNYLLRDKRWVAAEATGEGISELVRNCNSRIFGGHLYYSDFGESTQLRLFTAVVRSPVSRAVSLFNYHAMGRDESNRKKWARLGLDPSSMLRTIERVPAFRQSVANEQCRILGGDRTFDAVREALHKDNWILGIHDRLEEFNARLARLLSWSNTRLDALNTSPSSDYQRRILAEPGLEEAIVELNQEDLKLYEFLAELGVYQHTPDAETFRAHLAAPQARVLAQILRQDDVRGLKIEASFTDTVVMRGDTACVPLRIHNEGSRPLRREGDGAVMVGYTWLDRDGQVLQREGTKTPLPVDLPPGQSCIVQANLERPPFIQAGLYQVRFSLLQYRVRWLDTLDSGHTLTVDVAVEPSS